MSSPETEAVEQTGTNEVEEVVLDEASATILALFSESLGSSLVAHHYLPGQDLWLRVDLDAWVEAGQVARRQAKCTFFDFLSVIDWMPSPFGREMDSEVDNIVNETKPKDPGEMKSGFAGGDTRFQVFARVAQPSAAPGLILKVDVPQSTLTVDSWLPVYAGVNWHEREAWEMYGIKFAGHPYLRHLYLPSEFEGFPGRKDFPLLARRVKPWPGIVDVEPLPGVEDDGEGEGDS